MPTPYVPDERRSLRRVFFVSSMVLLATMVWALWDEAVSRRPWKAYQVAFNKLEYQQVGAELGAARQRLETPETQRILEELKTQLAVAEDALKSPAYRAAVAERDRLQRALAEANQTLQFTRSELDEASYFYDKARHEKGDVARTRAVVEELEREVAAHQPTVDAAQAAVDAAAAKVRAFEQQRQAVEAKLEEVTAEVRTLEARLEAVRNRPLEVKQVVVDGLQVNEFEQPIARVDRCETCHLGIERAGFEEAAQPFRTHPNRLAIFGKHPVAQFGCTGCHEGQGTALEVALAHRPKKYWERPMLKAEMTQATCLRCHRGQTEWVVAAPAPSPAGAAAAAGEAQAAEAPPAALVDLAPALSRGIILLETLGCFGCHNIRGYETAEKVGPDLTRIRAKVHPAWLVRWIQKPEGYLPHTRMPSFGLSEAEATAIAAYLLKHSEPAPRAAGTYVPAAPAARGRELFQQVGCYGCHQLRGVDGEAKPSTFFAQVDRDFAPDLSQVASKVTGADWLFAWLKNPKAFRPTTPMPSLRLSDAEASALTNFLLTLGKREPTPPGLQAQLGDPEVIEQGRRLIGKRGCFGCHEIRGFEKAEKIAPDLSNFANKRLLELFFGDATHVPETWEDYTFWKLKQPDIYATERIEQIMPNFRLSDGQVKALRVYLKSFSAEPAPHRRFLRTLTDAEQAVEAGRRLVRTYNCVGCHVMEGKGGDIRARFASAAAAPPPLILLDGLLSEGEKVQAPWLYEFLIQPTPIRPWLAVRMPTFGLASNQVTGLVGYFTGKAGLPLPTPLTYVGPLDPTAVAAGRRLTSKDYFDCFSCHQQGERKPEGPPEGWAPDLALARRRLRPEWMVKWITDPQKIQPGTRMPNFYPGGPDDILGGDEKRQIAALVEFILSLGR
jgi:mono/diheme cytochrome c family protein